MSPHFLLCFHYAEKEAYNTHLHYLPSGHTFEFKVVGRHDSTCKNVCGTNYTITVLIEHCVVIKYTVCSNLTFSRTVFGNITMIITIYYYLSKLTGGKITTMIIGPFCYSATTSSLQTNWKPFRCVVALRGENDRERMKIAKKYVGAFHSI